MAATPPSGVVSEAVLLFNVPRLVLNPEESFLARAPFSAETCDRPEDLTRRITETAYKMIILSLPSGGFEPQDILYILRYQKCASSHAVLVVLAPNEKIPEYRSYLSKGITAVFPLGSPAANLETALAAILQVAPRLNTRIMVRLSAHVHKQASRHLCQAVDLSRTGMFVATALKLPLGGEVEFELLLPNRPVPLSGMARVARHSAGMRDKADGMGLVFSSFTADGRARLNAFLESREP
jgi:hypothetical protein